MEYYEVFDEFQGGMAIRRASWDVNKYITYDMDNEGMFAPLDQNGTYYQLMNEELVQDDWELFDVTHNVFVPSLSDKQYLAYVQTKSLSVMQRLVRTLNTRMRILGERHDAVANWGDNWVSKQNEKKYCVVYSHSFNGYIIDVTYSMHYPLMVYFTKKEVAEECIKLYRPMMDTIRHVEQIRGVLFNNKDITREEIQAFDVVLEVI